MTEGVAPATHGFWQAHLRWMMSAAAFPFSARHGLRWWEVDLTWILLPGMEKLGPVANLKVPKSSAGPAPD